MTPDIDLSKLSHAEKDGLILSLLPLAAQLDTALSRIAELEKRLAQFERPPKTPDNSSMPPSKGQKPDRSGGDKPRKSRPGVGRALEADPDRVVDARLDACPHCAAAFAADQQSPQLVYDRIELPPIRPDVTRVRLFGGRCACCGERATATAPSGLEAGSPFGQSIVALVVYLHYAHAIGLERLAALMGEMFALSISEGAISNMLARAREPLLAAAAAIRWTLISDEATFEAVRHARALGDQTPITAQDMWDKVAGDVAAKPTRRLASTCCGPPGRTGTRRSGRSCRTRFAWITSKLGASTSGERCRHKQKRRRCAAPFRRCWRPSTEPCTISLRSVVEKNGEIRVCE